MLILLILKLKQSYPDSDSKNKTGLTRITNSDYAGFTRIIYNLFVRSSTGLIITHRSRYLQRMQSTGFIDEDKRIVAVW